MSVSLAVPLCDCPRHKRCRCCKLSPGPSVRWAALVAWLCGDLKVHGLPTTPAAHDEDAGRTGQGKTHLQRRREAEEAHGRGIKRR